MKAFSLGLCVIIVVLACPIAAQIEGSAEVVHPNQRVTVPDLAAITATKAGSPAVAKAAVAIALSASKVKCDRDSALENVLDADAGSSLRTLASKISGVSCVSDSRARRVAAGFTPNGAIQADSIIASLLQGKPLLLEWKGALYVLYGALYDEHLASNGSRMNVIRQLLLIDPRYADRRRFVAFERAKDNFADVEGIASIGVGGQ